MNKKILVLVLALFFCFAIVGAGAIFAYYWFSTAPDRALNDSGRNIITQQNVEFDASMALPMTMTVQNMSINMSLNVTGSGVYNTKDNSFSFDGTLTLPSFLGSESSSTPFKVMYVNRNIYFYDSTTSKWSYMNYDKLMTYAQAQNATTSPIPTPNLSGVTTPVFKYSKDDTVSNKAVFVYTSSADVAAINRGIAPYVQAAIDKMVEADPSITETYSSIGVDLRDVTITFSRADFEYMIYKDTNLPAKGKFTMTVNYNFGTKMQLSLVDSTFTVTLKNYNSGSTVVAPTNATEIDPSRPTSTTLNYDFPEL